jgi:hypothetical protein
VVHVERRGFHLSRGPADAHADTYCDPDPNPQPDADRNPGAYTEPHAISDASPTGYCRKGRRRCDSSASRSEDGYDRSRERADAVGDAVVPSPVDLEKTFGLDKPIPEVDRGRQTLHDGAAVTPDHRDLQPDGMQKAYVVLSDEERAKGFVRPVRLSYIHLKCSAVTRMGQGIAETYARDPEFYSGTFCATCRAHFPVGPAGEFRWDDGVGDKVGT